MGIGRPKMTAGTGAGRKIMSQISISFSNRGRRGWWLRTKERKKQRVTEYAGLEESNYKEQEESKLLIRRVVVLWAGHPRRKSGSLCRQRGGKTFNIGKSRR